MDPARNIEEKALELGFDLVGIAPAGASKTVQHYRDWLARGYHADLAWMANSERRADPRRVLEGARSVVSLGWSYFVQDPPATLWDDPSRGRVARYAWGPDYHEVMTPLLKELSAFITRESAGARTRYYVDTGPVLERSFASQAGLGFIGKNAMLISPSHGSYVFLAEILVDTELGYGTGGGEATTMRFGKGKKKEAGCGTCTRCLSACPTHAFPAAYVLDSRRCLSYLTIELKGAIPEELRPKLGNWIYGCDACQSVCPWVHRYARPAGRPFLSFDPERAAPDLLELMTLDDAAFNARYKGTPLRRTKRRGVLRNAAVALGNWGSPAALPVLRKAVQDPEPLIREHAGWAIDRIEAEASPQN